MKKSLLVLLCLMVVVASLQAQSIFIVTDAPDLEEPGMGNLGDFLRDLGYSVTPDPGIEAIGDPGDNDSAFHGPLSAEQQALLNSFDLVIFHRSTNSGDFNNLTWNELTVPLLNGSSYVARNSRWLWVNNANSPTDNCEFLEVADDSHPIFTGVTIEDGFVRLFDEGVPQDVNGLEVAGDLANGTVLAETEFLLHTAIGVWDQPGEFYPGGGTHTNRIVFFALSRYFEDDGSGAIAFEHYSEEGLKLLANSVEFAIYGDVQGRTPTKIKTWNLY